MSLNTNGILAGNASLSGLSPQSSPLTISVWVKPVINSNTYHIFSLEKSSQIWAFALEQRGGTGSNHRVNSISTFTDTSMPLGIWGHSVMSSDTDFSYDYTYGSKGTSGTGTSASTDLDLLFLGTPVVDRNGFDGLIAHFAIWNSILSQIDRDALVGGANPAAVSPGTLLLYQPLGAGFNESGYIGLTGWTLNNGITFTGSDNPIVDAPPSGSNILYRTRGMSNMVNIKNIKG